MNKFTSPNTYFFLTAFITVATAPMQAASGNSNVVTPSEKPPCSNYYAFPNSTDPVYAEIDLLYWLPSISDMDYILTRTEAVFGAAPYNPESSTTFGTGDLHSGKFSWNYGVRGVLGYSVKDTPWYLSADYTYFNTSKDGSTTAPEGPYAYLTGFNQYQGTVTSVISASYSTQFNYQTSRLFAIGASFHPVPELGIDIQVSPKITYVKRGWTTKFQGNPTADLYRNSTNISDWHYFAGGLNITLASDFNLGRGFGIDLLAGVSGMYGKMSGTFTSSVYQPVLNSTISILNISQSDHRVLWESQIKAALSWSRIFSHTAIHLAVGYEFNMLENIGNLMIRNQESGDFLDDANMMSYQNEPIFIQGIVASLGFAF